MWTRHDAIRRGVAPRSSARYAELCSAPEVGALAVARSIPALALVVPSRSRAVLAGIAPQPSADATSSFRARVPENKSAALAGLTRTGTATKHQSLIND